MNRLSVGTARSASSRRSSRQLRSGVSLLEVMFSIGVVMIGLVGIGALIPVGGAWRAKAPSPTPPLKWPPTGLASSVREVWRTPATGAGTTRRHLASWRFL